MAPLNVRTCLGRQITKKKKIIYKHTHLHIYTCMLVYMYV